MRGHWLPADNYRTLILVFKHSPYQNRRYALTRTELALRPAIRPASTTMVSALFLLVQALLASATWAALVGLTSSWLKLHVQTGISVQTGIPVHKK